MLIQQLNRTDPERVQIIVKNVDGAGSITTGLGASLCEAGNSIDGVGAIRFIAGNAKGFCGVAAQDIAINSWGRVTAWGYAASVQVSAVGTSLTTTAGDLWKAGAAAGTFFSSVAPETASTLFYKYVYCASTLTISANPVWLAGVVRAL